MSDIETRAARSIDQATFAKEASRFLDSSQIALDEDTLKTWGSDWTRSYRIDPLAVVYPKTIDQLVQLVKLARRNDVKLVPSGGRTGLSGGAVASDHEVVVSMDRMNQILDFNPVDRIVTCQAGVITANLQEFANEQELFYPVDFASSGSSQIGGNIATNAGGIRVIRYGMTRESIAGLKVVTGTGDVLDLNKGLMKNATGYDLRHLFIGSEGTLGFIAEAEIRLIPPPENQKVQVLGVNDLTGHTSDSAALPSTNHLIRLRVFFGSSDAVRFWHIAKTYSDLFSKRVLTTFYSNTTRVKTIVLRLHLTKCLKGSLLSMVSSANPSIRRNHCGSSAMESQRASQFTRLTKMTFLYRSTKYRIF